MAEGTGRSAFLPHCTTSEFSEHSCFSPLKLSELQLTFQPPRKQKNEQDVEHEEEQEPGLKLKVSTSGHMSQCLPASERTPETPGGV